MNKSFLNNSNKDKGESWLNVSDMMAGLMMVFLLIVINKRRLCFMENLEDLMH